MNDDKLKAAAQALADEQAAACATDHILALEEMAASGEEVLVSAKLLLELFASIPSSAGSAVVMSEVQSNPQAVTYPAEIWLQVGGDCDPDECAPYSEIEHKREITWCEESIDRMDVRYMRADLAAAAPLYAAAQAIPQPPEQGSSLYVALQRAFDELLPYTSIRIQAERGIGWVEWKDTKGQWHVIDGDGWLCSDINDALDKITSCTTGDSAIGEKGNG